MITFHQFLQLATVLQIGYLYLRAVHSLVFLHFISVDADGIIPLLTLLEGS